jgi:ketosteroid isomerase-like protein
VADDLERTVRRLVDKDEIVDLVHRYSHLVDHRRYDEVAGLFTDDCEVDYGIGGGEPIRGRDALAATFGAMADSRHGFAATSHHNANVLVTFEGDDRASVRTSVYAWHQAPDGTTPRIWGWYYDVVARTAEGWRLAVRQLRVTGNEGWPADWLPLDD